jgi:hypothetical protein
MSKIVSKGQRLQLSVASVFTTVAQLDRITGPDHEVIDVEVPTLDQADNSIEHDTTGYTEPGTVDFSGFIDPALAIHQQFTDEAVSPTHGGRSFKIIYSDNTEVPFTAIPKKFTPAAEVGNLVRVDGQLQLTKIATYPS